MNPQYYEWILNVDVEIICENNRMQIAKTFIFITCSNIHLIFLQTNIQWILLQFLDIQRVKFTFIMLIFNSNNNKKLQLHPRYFSKYKSNPFNSLKTDLKHSFPYKFIRKPEKHKRVLLRLFCCIFWNTLFAIRLNPLWRNTLCNSALILKYIFKHARE